MKLASRYPGYLSPVHMIRLTKEYEIAPPHQCMTTMKSVPFPVSWLNPLSEIINEEAGVSSSEILSTVSWGISMRSRAALALSGDGADRGVCFAGASRSFLASPDM